MGAERVDDVIPRLIPYTGAKHRAAALYPPPKYGLIIEPFAGSAAYACRYPDNDVILCDVYPRLTAVWKYLTTASPSEILALPLLSPGESLPDSLEGAARDLVGWWIQRASGSPGRTMPQAARTTPRAFWNERIRARIADAVPRIRHWRVEQASYETLANVEATWFIDPPYASVYRAYMFDRVDYAHLGTWCRSRLGQVIVCENDQALWLPFRPLASWAAVPAAGRGRVTREVVWLSDNPGNPPD